jgi:hypothetical protein
VLDEQAAVVLRLQSGYMLQEWTRRLRHSAAQMRSVANWHRAGDTQVHFISCHCRLFARDCGTHANVTWYHRVQL